MTRILSFLAILTTIAHHSYGTSFLNVHHSSSFAQNLLLESLSTDLKNLLNPTPEEWERLKDQSKILHEFAIELKDMKKCNRHAFMAYAKKFRIPNLQIEQKLNLYHHLSKVNYYDRKPVYALLRPTLRYTRDHNVKMIIEALKEYQFHRTYDNSSSLKNRFNNNFSKNYLLASVSEDLKTLINPTPDEWEILKNQSEILYDFAINIKNMIKRSNYKAFIRYANQYDIKNSSTSQKMMFYYYLSMIDKNQRRNLSYHLKGVLRFMQGDDITPILKILKQKKYTQKIEEILAIHKIMTIEDRLSNRTKKHLLKITSPFIKSEMSEFEKNHILSVFSDRNVYEREQLADMLTVLGIGKKSSGISSIIEGLSNLFDDDKKLLLRLSQKILAKITNPDFRTLYFKNLLSIEVSFWRYYAYRLNAEITPEKEDNVVHAILYTSIPDLMRI